MDVDAGHNRLVRICMVLEYDFPPDIRVEKEARALLEAGHEVTVVCGNSEGRPEVDAWEGARVLRTAGGRMRLGIARLARLLFFRDPRFARMLRRCERTVDAFHVHDLPLAGTVLAVARRNRLPVVLDLHENFPDLVQSSRQDLPLLYRTSLSAVSSVSRWRRYERRVADAASAVIVVVEEGAERLVAAGIPRNRIAVVENTEDAQRFLALPVAPVVEIANRGAVFVLGYVGGLGGRHRGLETVIDAMPIILRSAPEALLVLVGEGPIRPRLERRLAELGIEDNVLMLGRQPFERIPSFMAASDVCLVPHAAHAQTAAALPHKLFQYMLMAKPVVVSSCRPLRRVVEETGAGVVFEADNPESLAGCVLALRDPERRHTLGEAGREAASTVYNWPRSAERLVDVYANLPKASARAA
jgi:glycosyltransferase involved in cell wall biosynthesis